MPTIKRPKIPKKRKQLSPQDAPIGTGYAKGAKLAILERKKKQRAQLDEL